MEETKSEPIECNKLCDPITNNPIEVTSDNIAEVIKCDKIQSYIGKGSNELEQFIKDNKNAYRPHVMKGYCGYIRRGGTRNKKIKRRNTKKRRNVKKRK